MNENDEDLSSVFLSAVHRFEYMRMCEIVSIFFLWLSIESQCDQVFKVLKSVSIIFCVIIHSMQQLCCRIFILFWFYATHTLTLILGEMYWNNKRQTLSLYVINSTASVEFQKKIYYTLFTLKKINMTCNCN